MILNGALGSPPLDPVGDVHHHSHVVFDQDRGWVSHEQVVHLQRTLDLSAALTYPPQVISAGDDVDSAAGESTPLFLRPVSRTTR